MVTHKTAYAVWNRSKQTRLAFEVERADTWWARMKGLLGRSSDDFGRGRGLWLEPCQAIHTIGMSFAIDVVYLDSTSHVIHTCQALQPCRLAAFKFRARSVLELPAGSLACSDTQTGDLLEFTPTSNS